MQTGKESVSGVANRERSGGGYQGSPALDGMVIDHDWKPQDADEDNEEPEREKRVKFHFSKCWEICVRIKLREFGSAGYGLLFQRQPSAEHEGYWIYY